MRLIGITEGTSQRGHKRLRVHLEARLRELGGREVGFAVRAAAKHRTTYDLKRGRPNQGPIPLTKDVGNALLRVTVSFPARLVTSATTHRMLRSATRAYRKTAPRGPRLYPWPNEPDALLAALVATEVRRAGETTDAPWVAAVSALQRRADQLRRVADQLTEDGLHQA